MSDLRTVVERTGADLEDSVVVRYWAGARQAAGVESDVVVATTVGEALDAVLDLRPALAPILALSSVLVDGHAGSASERERQVQRGGVVEVLPPFAGG